MMVQPLSGKPHSSHHVDVSSDLAEAFDSIIRDKKATELYFVLGEGSTHGVPLAL